jgi:outer membrane lipoprotein LolB
VRPPLPAPWRRRSLLAALALPLAACAPLQRQTSGPVYSGRLSLSVRSEPPQNLSAGFDLRGQAREGDLLLTSPLGTTLAQAVWRPGQAELKASGQQQVFGSMEELLARLTGAAIPLAALFDWMDGRDTPVPGWESDLSGHAQGRLSARRLSPLPTVELRLLLDPR